MLSHCGRGSYQISHCEKFDRGRCAWPRENGESPEATSGTEYQGIVIAARSKEGDFRTCCGRVSYQTSHCEKFDMYLHWRRLYKRTFRDRDFGCKVLMARPYRVKEDAECRMRNYELWNSKGEF
jgi:hypothetical protein